MEKGFIVFIVIFFFLGIVLSRVGGAAGLLHKIKKVVDKRKS